MTRKVTLICLLASFTPALSGCGGGSDNADVMADQDAIQAYVEEHGEQSTPFALDEKRGPGDP